MINASSRSLAGLGNPDEWPAGQVVDDERENGTHPSHPQRSQLIDADLGRHGSRSHARSRGVLDGSKETLLAQTTTRPVVGAADIEVSGRLVHEIGNDVSALDGALAVVLEIVPAELVRGVELAGCLVDARGREVVLGAVLMDLEAESALRSPALPTKASPISAIVR